MIPIRAGNARFKMIALVVLGLIARLSLCQTIDQLTVRAMEKYQRRDYPGAIADYRAALKWEPVGDAKAGILANLAIAEALAGDRTAAIADFERAVQASPNNSEIYGNRANFRFEGGDLNGAIQDVEQSLKLRWNLAAIVVRGRIKHQKKDYDGAIEDFQKALSVNRSSVGYWNLLGLSHMEKGALQDALNDFNHALELEPKSVESINNRGSVKERLKDFTGAISDYDAAISINPKFGSAYNNRGMLAWNQGDVSRALSDFEKAIQAQPTLVNAYLNRGKILKDKSEFSNALKDYSKAIELDPRNPTAWMMRGNVKFALKDYQGALADQNRAIEADPTAPEPYTNRGLAKAALNDLVGALADHSKCIEISPNVDFPYNNRGNVYQDLGKMGLAIGDYTQAIRLNPKNSTAYTNRGDARFFNGDPDGAIKDYVSALQMNNKDTLALRGMAWVAMAKHEWNAVIYGNKMAADRGGGGSGPLTLALAAQASNLPAAGTFRDRLGSLQGLEFQPTLGRYVAGKSTEQEVLAAAKMGEAGASKNRLAMANYYIGMRKLLDGDSVGARDHFKQSVQSEAILMERAAAGIELNRLDGIRK